MPHGKEHLRNVVFPGGPVHQVFDCALWPPQPFSYRGQFVLARKFNAPASPSLEVGDSTVRDTKTKTKAAILTSS